MKIEKMSDADLPRVTELAAQLGYISTESEISARFLDIKNIEAYKLLVAKTANQEVIGWMQINLEPASLLIGPRVDIAALVVDERYRSQGIGKALIEQAEIWSREKGISLLRLKSNVSRETAHRFYERQGFTLSKTSKLFIKNLI